MEINYSLPLDNSDEYGIIRIGAKIKTGDIYIIDELKTNSPSTKYVVGIVNELALSGKTLIVVDSIDQNLLKSVRNIPETNLIQVSILNVLEAVRNKNMVITKQY